MTITRQRKILRTIVTTATKSGLRALPGRTCGGLLAGSPSALGGGSASPSVSTLGRLAGRPWCPPSLLRQSSAFDKERPLTRPVFLLAYGRSTCAELASRLDTKVSHDDTAEWKESRCGAS